MDRVAQWRNATQTEVNQSLHPFIHELGNASICNPRGDSAMTLTVVITGAFFGGLLMSVLSHTWRLGSEANRNILFTIVIILAILTIHGV